MPSENYMDYFESVSVKNLQSRFLTNIPEKQTSHSTRSSMRKTKLVDKSQSSTSGVPRLKKQTTINDLKMVPHTFDTFDNDHKSLDFCETGKVIKKAGRSSATPTLFSNSRHTLDSVGSTPPKSNDISPKLSRSNDNIITNIPSNKSSTSLYDEDEVSAISEELRNISDPIERIFAAIGHKDLYQSFLDYGYDDPLFIRDIVDDDDLETLEIINTEKFYEKIKSTLTSANDFPLKNIKNLNDLLDSLNFSNYRDKFINFTFENIYDPDIELELVDVFENLPIGYWKRILFYLNIILSNLPPKTPTKPTQLRKHSTTELLSQETHDQHRKCRIANENILDKDFLLEINQKLNDIEQKRKQSDDGSYSHSVDSGSANSPLGQLPSPVQTPRSKTMNHHATLSSEFCYGTLRRGPSINSTYEDGHYKQRSKTNILQNMKLFSKYRKNQFQSELNLHTVEMDLSRTEYFKVQYIGMHTISDVENKSRKIVEDAFNKFRGSEKLIEKLPIVGLTIDLFKISINNHKSKSNLFDSYFNDIFTFTQDTTDLSLFAYTSFFKVNQSIKYIAQVFRASKAKTVDKICRVLFERFSSS